MPPPPDRLLDLLADRALQGLPPAEDVELTELLRAHPEVDPTSLECAAAAAALAFASSHLGPMPAHLAEPILAGKQVPTIRVAAAAVPRPSRWRTAVTWGGWVAAAACLALAFGPELIDRVAPPSPWVRLVKRDGVRPASWELAPGVSGDLIWDTARQEGCLRIVGLRPNDPEKEQYQLWIIDPRSAGMPVDGGVFNVPSRTEEVTFLFRPARPVPGAKVFAVTLERAGGVAVSRQPRLAVATLP